jgi:hypothetical protein
VLGNNRSADQAPERHARVSAQHRTGAAKLIASLLTLPLLAQQPGSRLKLPDILARDASILADADSRTYYFYASVEPAGSVVVYRSKDLSNWEGPAPVFQIPAGSWANPAQGVGDARVYPYRGKYYLFATLFNAGKIIAKPPDSWRVNTMQGTQVFVAESPQGPFSPVPGGGDKPYTPADFVAQGGSLYVEGDTAWLVYAHDWTQLVDAVVEAVHLKADLSAPAEDPIYLFKGSDAPWLPLQKAASREPRYYPAAGPSVYRTRNGALMALWSGPKERKSAVVQARSVTGRLRGPWRQDAALLAEDSTFPTIFKAFDGRLLMLVNQPAEGGRAKAKLVELEDTGDTLRVKPAAAKQGGTSR